MRQATRVKNAHAKKREGIQGRLPGESDRTSHSLNLPEKGRKGERRKGDRTVPDQGKFMSKCSGLGLPS